MSKDALYGYAARLVRGLERRSISKASEWALQYRRTPQGKHWSFERGPWTRELHDSKAEENCCKKGAQLWLTETLLSVAMYANDVLKQDVLYVLPTQHPDATGFSIGRFDAAVAVSPYISQLYRECNVGLKRAGAACTYIRGGQSDSALKSVPVARLILDERNEMSKRAARLAYERLSGQVVKSLWEVSTPTVEGHGIEEPWLDSTQERFFFNCPGCGRSIDLNYPENLQIIGDDPGSKQVNESYLKCHHCSYRLDHDSKHIWMKDGIWVPQVTDRTRRGFYVNQLYSTTVTPGQLAASAIRAQNDETEEQEFYNSKLGLSHTPKGARISEADINCCKRHYTMGGDELNPRDFDRITMGADIGSTWNHVEIDGWKLGDRIGGDINADATPTVLWAGRVRDFEELDSLWARYGVDYAVVDAQPERRKAQEFALRHYGRASICLYLNGINGRFLSERPDDGDPVVAVDRTSWLDVSLGRFRREAREKEGRKTINLPKDIGAEYVTHMTNIARIPKKDKNGHAFNQYVAPDKKGDHHAHARNYAEIALALCVGHGEAQFIEDPI